MDVLIIDEHPLYSDGLESMLNVHFPFYKVTSVACYDLNSSFFKLAPINIDLVLLGVNNLESISCTYLERLLTTVSHIPTIVLSALADNEFIKKMLDLGVRGVIPKNYTNEKIVEAIIQCCNGHGHIPFSNLKAISQLKVQATKRNAAIKRLKLTKRQLEVLELINERFRNHEIADKLFVSVATVKTHINKIYAAFDVNSRKACLSRAYDLGIFY